MGVSISKQILSAVVLLALAGCGPIHNQIRLPADSETEISSLVLNVPKEGEFTVFYERATATTAPAAMFGLIGAAVASASNGSADSKITDSLAAQLDSTSCSAEFKRSFLATLSEKSNIEARKFGEGANSLADTDVQFEIEYCGFRVVNKERMHMAPFIEMYAKMTMRDSGTVIWDDRETVVGSSRTTLVELQSDSALVRKAFEGILKEAGQKMAYKIAYL